VPLRFVFALHNHQPVGNFGSVFESAYRDSYLPFLELMEQYPEIPFSLHTSGCLLEWLVEHRPDYIERLRYLVGRGQVEILGGGFYEPILPMIPPCDRLGQIRTYTTYLEKLFSTRIRGMWVPERVWEQTVVSDIAAAGIEYTVLDDHHFRQAGLEDRLLFGYYLTEDDGRLLRVFPGSERMRYLVPFRNPEESIAYFGEVAGQNPDAVIVFADDGEKFGSWPETHRHCYIDGWLRRFLDQLRYARTWVRLCTFSQALDETPPAGRVYLPDNSYREMTEWALPAARLSAYQQLVRELEHDSRWQRIQPFLRGGYWRNFKNRYPETQEMYCRMLQVSRLLQVAEGDAYEARLELYRAQCNCAWWHGAFGGLYLPHLRNAVYQHLLAAENAVLAAAKRPRTWIEAQVEDSNLDGAAEVCLRNNHLAAYLNPQNGGSLYELDILPIKHNVLATLARRPEAYHNAIRRNSEHNPEHIRVKQAGLERLLQYDSYLRKALLDHFFDPALTLQQLASGDAKELGDFLNGAYEPHVIQNGLEASVTLRRAGQVMGRPVQIEKTVRLRADSSNLEIHYQLSNLPPGPLHFAMEFNFAGMAAGADDRYFYHEGQPRAGQLQTLQDLAPGRRLGLVDEWLGLDASLALSRPGGIWACPVQTVSQSEGGFELVYQSTAVLPHWLIEPDAAGGWSVALELRLNTTRAEQRAAATKV
jgi:alpha-amylase